MRRPIARCSTPMAGSSATPPTVARLWDERRAREAAVAAHRAEVERAEREAEWLRHAVDELTPSGAAGRRGDRARRAARRHDAGREGRRRFAHDARSVAGAAIAGAALATALRRLERRAAQAPALIEPAVKAIDAALVGPGRGARAHLEAALRVADYDPNELERIEERLFALRAAGRKYNVPVDDLGALARPATPAIWPDRCRRRTARRARDARRPRRGALPRGRASAVGASAAAPPPSSTRPSTPSSSRSSSIAPVSRPRSPAADEGPDGIDRVEFWVRTNPGTRPGPLMKIASGGELARFLLALKVVLADRGSAPTLIFDEIDTGVGGAVADAIGVRLARLASGVQVIAVTHAPQVAARADRHYLISKDALGKRQAGRHPHRRACGREAARGDRPHAGRRRNHRRSRAAAERLIAPRVSRHSGAERSEEPGIHKPGLSGKMNVVHNIDDL